MSDASIFTELRPLLFGIAYRMTGSAAEADDVVQDAYLRWARVDASCVESPRAYLTTIVTRLAIDRLRSARARRETYKGPWLPEPILVEEADSGHVPAGLGDPFGSIDAVGAGGPTALEGTAREGGELADSLSLAFLVLLEELAPSERAAFLLRDVFVYEYDEIAECLGRSEPACRQLVSRARRRIGDRRRRFDADRQAGRELARKFVLACSTGDMEELMSLLTEDVIVWTDGGGRVKAALKPIVGPERASRFLTHVSKSLPGGSTMREGIVNGQPGFVLELEGSAIHAVVLDVLGGRIAGVRVVSNPEKLTAVSEVRARGRPPLLE